MQGQHNGMCSNIGGTEFQIFLAIILLNFNSSYEDMHFAGLAQGRAYYYGTMFQSWSTMADTMTQCRLIGHTNVNTPHTHNAIMGMWYMLPRVC